MIKSSRIHVKSRNIQPWTCGPLLCSFAVLATACVTSIGLASDVPVVRTLEAVRGCTGSCEPTLVKLTNGHVISLWAAENGHLWAQTIDPMTGTLLGAGTQLGQLTTGSGPVADQPLAVALHDGDLALIGLLADGRITFTRGSENAARRVPPRVVIPPTEGEVIGLAAGTASADRVTVLVLRGPPDFDRQSLRPAPHMQVEFYVIGANGEASPPQRWTSAHGFAPRVASCGSNQYLAWQSADHIVFSVIGADGQRSPDYIVPPARKRTLSHLGSLLCHGPDAQLLVSWKRTITSSETTREVSVAVLKPTHAIKPQWKTFQLPGPPDSVLLNGGQLAAHQTQAAVEVLVDREQYSQFIEIDLQRQKLAALPLRVPRRHECLPLSSTRVLCASSKAVDPSDSCPNAPARVEFSFFGEILASPTPQPAFSYWKVATIDQPEAVSAATAARQQKRLRCGEAGWNGLRQALELWCAGDAREDDARALTVYCSRDDEASLLYQAQRCTNLPARCLPSKFTIVPSVDRAEFEQGQRIELSYMNCSVWFARESGSLRVVDRECGGD